MRDAETDLGWQALEELFNSLPAASAVRDSQGLNERFYLCDNEGWVRAALEEAMRRAGDCP